MLSALEKVIQERKLQSLLDFGAGSGILAIAGAKLGVGRVVAWEIDSSARKICRRNIDLNEVSWVQVPEMQPKNQCYDVVCCNIQPPLLTSLAADLVACLNPGGTLILSGFTRLDEGSVKNCFSRLGLELQHTLEQSQWLAQEWKLASKTD